MGRTRNRRRADPAQRDFNSLAPCGANHLPRTKIADERGFQLTRPVWGEPEMILRSLYNDEFQLTRPVWGEPRCQAAEQRPAEYFNSLAPCGANQSVETLLRNKRNISTHSPRVGRTAGRGGRMVLQRYFNSLAPCGANHDAREHARQRGHFNSLAPCGANHRRYGQNRRSAPISTHSPRVGRTRTPERRGHADLHFNSLAPCGANHASIEECLQRLEFQLTRPVWGEPLHLVYL